MIKAFLLSVLIIGALSEDCSNLNGEYGCQGDQKAYPDSWDERRWQTPPRNDEHWKESYQDMHDVVGYAQLKYSSDRRICTIKFIATVNPALGNYQVLYKFGDREQESNSFTVTPSQTQSYKDGFPISCRVLVNGQEKAKLVLEDEYFLWDNPTVNQGSQYEGGQKGAIVELFGWPYNDIAEECDFLGTAGYMAVKVFPVGEHILTYDTVEDGELNPWWFIYQPVSYRLTSRGGTKKEFKNMINTCRQKGVRVYADAVINHMAGNGNDMYWDHRNHAGSCVHWGAKNGSDGSPWWTTGWQFENNRYTGKRPGLEFPAVPYTASDFHCERSLNSWTDPNILSRGWLTGLTDLNTEKDYVRQRIADFITSMLSMGVSGIRVDAAKHIHPTDLAAIFKKLKDNLGGGELPEDFTAYLEVLFGGEKDLLMCGGGDYSFGKPFVNKMKAVGLSDSDILKIKIWGSDYPKEFPICGYWEIDPIRHAIWKIKLVLSSYSFIGNAYGYPDGKSDCSRCNPNTQCSQNCRRSVPYQKAYNPNSQGYDAGSSGNWKENTYTRTHRDREVVNAMRQWMGLSSLSSDQLYAKERLKARQMGL